MSRVLILAAALSGGLLACSDPASTAPPAAPSAADGGAGSAGSAAGSGGEAAQQPPPPPVVDAAPVRHDAGPIDAMVPVSDDDDAGVWKPPEPDCSTGDWNLAPGFRVAMPLDYVADRYTPVDMERLPTGKTTVLSEAGMPCFTAKDRERCLAAVRLPGGDGRHLLTTRGDDAKLWNLDTAQRVLGLIDTPHEAIWWLIANGGHLVPCGEARVVESELGLVVENALSTTCGPTPNGTHRSLRVRVEPSGVIAELGPVDPLGPICQAGNP